MAVLIDIEIPENCLGCPASGHKAQTCAFTGNKIPHQKPFKAKECPLKFAEDGCQDAEKLLDGKCKGYQKSRWDDEPVYRCKECKLFELFGIELERSTVERFNSIKEIAFYAHAGFSKERISETLKEVVSELQKYREAEESGLLIKLPVVVGKSIYVTEDKYRGKKVIDHRVAEFSVDRFIIGQNGTPVAVACNQENHWEDFELQDFGKTIFLTREDAEMEEMEV